MIVEARTETDEAAREALYHDVLNTALRGRLLHVLLIINDIYGTSDRLNWGPRVECGAARENDVGASKLMAAGPAHDRPCTETSRRAVMAMGRATRKSRQ